MQTMPTFKPGFFGRLKLIFDFERDTIAVFDKLTQHGDILCLELFGSKQYVMFHPDMYHDVLVSNTFIKDGQYTSERKGMAYFLGKGLLTSNDEFWRRQRKLASPAFHTKRVEAYAETMVDFSLQTVDIWHDNEIRDIDHEMMKLTLRIVTKTLFDTDMADDARRIGDHWEVFTHGGRRATGIDSLEHARNLARLGAGELLVTSMDRDGTRDGYDLELTRAVADAVDIPVIASGGVGTLDHLVEGVRDGHASAVLAASIFHFGEATIGDAHNALGSAGYPVRQHK